MQQLTDNALMLKVKQGDLDKLGLLYERHKKKLFGFFHNRNQNIAISEDLVQNVFVRMLKYKHTYTGEGSFVAWMFKTARNVSYDYHAKHKKEYNLKELSSLEYKLEDRQNFDSQMDKKDEISLLNSAMGKLSPDKREILILSKLKRIKYYEIGEILGCSQGAAKVKVHRALNDLRNIYLQLDKK